MVRSIRGYQETKNVNVASFMKIMEVKVFGMARLKEQPNVIPRMSRTRIVEIRKMAIILHDLPMA